MADAQSKFRERVRHDVPGPRDADGRLPVRLPAHLTSPRSKLVYLYLALVEEAAARDICEQLRMDLLTVFAVLDALVERGLVERDGLTYRCRA